MNLNKFDDAFKQMIEYSESLREKHLWKMKFKDNNFDTIFDNLTKNDLITIKQTLSIPINTNLKKNEFLKELKKNYFHYLENYLTLLIDEHFEDLEMISNNEEYLIKDYDLIYFYKNAGLAFPVVKNQQHALIIPKETVIFLKETKSKLNKIIKRNSELINILRGLLEYYGVLNRYTAWEMIQAYFPKETISFDTFNRIVEISSDSHLALGLNHSYLYNFVLSEDEITDIANEQKSKMIDYYPITKFKALKASDEFFVEKTPQVRKLIVYLKTEYSIQESEIEIIINKIITLIKIGLPFNDVIQDLNEMFEFQSLEEMQEIVELVKEVHNNTRMWPLKGHTPNELRKNRKPSDITEDKKKPVTKKKIGRNEPCPCGSGKKYKQCCIDK